MGKLESIDTWDFQCKGLWDVEYIQNKICIDFIETFNIKHLIK